MVKSPTLPYLSLDSQAKRRKSRESRKRRVVRKGRGILRACHPEKVRHFQRRIWRGGVAIMTEGLGLSHEYRYDHSATVRIT
jgi:hypothetical protein